MLNFLFLQFQTWNSNTHETAIIMLLILRRIYFYCCFGPVRITCLVTTTNNNSYYNVQGTFDLLLILFRLQKVFL